MFESFQKPLPLAQARAGAALVDTTTRWLDIDDDVALGCECADPSLQIECWGKETAPSAPAPS